MKNLVPHLSSEWRRMLLVSIARGITVVDDRDEQDARRRGDGQPASQDNETQGVSARYLFCDSATRKAVWR